jgi:HlyD family secretion protein
MKPSITISLLVSLFAWSCNKGDNEFDATGTFEATETIVSAEANGRILSLRVEEGDNLAEGAQVGYIDSTQLYLTRLQLLENQKAVLAGRPNMKTQMESTRKEIESTRLDQKRMENLVKAQVANQKQLDDVNAHLSVLEARLAAQENSLNTSILTINQQSSAISAQLAAVEDQLKKCRIVNPVAGTVLTKYAMANEVASQGRPLYRVADIRVMNLRAYVTGDQFSAIKLNQKVKVFVDEKDGKYREYEGLTYWINDKAEFTPKTIQTKAERANLVYAVKIRVQNDGLLKWGMYGEVKFQ